MTQAESQARRANTMKRKICALLQWDELEYAEFIYNTGLKYLQFYIPRDPDGIDKLVTTKLYWNWWKNNWTNREWAYLTEHEDMLWKLSKNNRLMIYEYVHDPELLSKACTPPGVVLQDTYAELIGAVIKEEVAS